MKKLILIFITICLITSCWKKDDCLDKWGSFNEKTNKCEISKSQNLLEKNTKAKTWDTIKKLIYIDVREKDEWDLGHIKWAIHIPLWDIMEGNYSQISKNTPVWLYCRSWRRADIALEALKKAWYTNIVNLGGITDIKNIEIVK